jgi:hypothetical protein
MQLVDVSTAGIVAGVIVWLKAVVIAACHPSLLAFDAPFFVCSGDWRGIRVL